MIEKTGAPVKIKAVVCDENELNEIKKKVADIQKWVICSKEGCGHKLCSIGDLVNIRHRGMQIITKEGFIKCPRCGTIHKI